MGLQYSKTLKGATWSVGDIVLMIRPMNEKGVSFKLLPKLKGPYRIKEVHSEHSVSLESCITGEVIQDTLTQLPEKISTERLVKFEGAQKYEEEVEVQQKEPIIYEPGQMLAVAKKKADKEPVDICKIIQVLKDDEMLQVEYFKNTGDKLFQKRPWSTDRTRQVELVHISSVLCPIQLDSSGAMEEDSILEMITKRAEFPGQRRKKGGILVRQVLARILH